MSETKFSNATVTVEDTAQSDHDGRPVFEWTVTLDSGEAWSAEDLKGPVMGEPSEDDMLRSFYSFLGAALEARSYRVRLGLDSENEDLFPAAMLDWAEEHEDEIGMFSLEDE